MTHHDDSTPPSLPAATATAIPELPPFRPAPRLPIDSVPSQRRRLDLVRSADLLVTGLLDECHFLMREIASESAARAETVSDRLAFITSALSCASTGAKLGKSIAAMQNMSISIDRANAIVLELRELDRRVESESDKQ